MAVLASILQKLGKLRRQDVRKLRNRQLERGEIRIEDIKLNFKSVEKLARMTHEEANRRLSLTPPAGCRNSFSWCNDGKATSDDLHRKDWDGSSQRAGPGGSSPTVLTSRRGHYWTSIEGRCRMPINTPFRLTNAASGCCLHQTSLVRHILVGISGLYSPAHSCLYRRFT